MAGGDGGNAPHLEAAQPSPRPPRPLVASPRVVASSGARYTSRVPARSSCAMQRLASFVGASA